MSAAARSYWIPGRIEFLGKHTDYAGGRSLVCATERGITLHATPRGDARVHVSDTARGEHVALELSATLTARAGHWSGYFATVARRLARDFPDCRQGADIEFSSDLPQDAGLSSSSALIVACYVALSDVNNLPSRAGEDLAGYLGAVESGAAFGDSESDAGVGTAGGSQDHTAILCARPGALSQYAFMPVRHERQVPLPDDLVFVVAGSGVAAPKTGAARESYNRASLQTREILARWCRATGKSVPSLAAALRSSPGARNELRALVAGEPALRDRLEQWSAESEEIVPATGDALLRRDLDTVGRLVDRSQALAERCLGNQVPETMFLARAARELGAVAASAFGAGFGGSVWALVEETAAEDLRARWAERYAGVFPERAPRAEFFISRAGRAMHRI